MSLAALAVAAALAGPQEINLDNGLGLLRTCEDENLSLMCLGYLKGVTDAVDVYAMVVGRPSPWCMPDGITLGDMRQVIVEDLRKRRDLWTDMAPAVVAEVLGTNFRCPTSAASPSAPGQ